jgi:Ca2+-binding EF-hand superfamily protein
MLIAVLTAMMMALGGYAFAGSSQFEQTVQAKFDQVDKDNDGKISYDEYLDVCEASFEGMDTNGDGYITREETAAKRGELKERRRLRRQQRTTQSD